MIMRDLTRMHLDDLGYEARVSEHGRNIQKSDILLRPAVAERFYEHVLQIARGKGYLQVAHDHKTRQVCIFVDCPVSKFPGCTDERIYYLCRDMTETEIKCLML